MRPGVIGLSEEASLRQVQRTMVSHGVHAVLVLGARSGRPLGWVTARHPIALIERDPELTAAREAITQEVVALDPGDTVREAIAALAQSGSSHLLIAKHDGHAPEGVVSELELLAVACR